MSNDPEQEFFSDGITEDIITDLSKVSGLFVLGRNTVFTYKGKAVNLEQIARQLGVAYVVEGSVRKAGNRVRINAQLIEGATGGHLWADRYDRDLTDIFAIQDEITKTIVEQLKVKLLPEEKKAIEQAPTDNVEAYTHYLRGRQFFHTRTKSSLMLGRRMFARAVELDPLYRARLRRYGGLRFASLFQARRRDFGRRYSGDHRQGLGDRSQFGGSACCPRLRLDDRQSPRRGGCRFRAGPRARSQLL